MATEETMFAREAKGPLPDALQWLALEYRLFQNDKPLTERLWIPRGDEAITDDVDPVARWGHSLRQCFNLIGTAEYIDPARPSVFGTDKCRRLRVDVVATSAALDKWTYRGGGLCCFRREAEPDYWVDDIAGPDGSVAVLSHAQLMPTAAHMLTEKVCAGIGQHDSARGFDFWKGVFLDDDDSDQAGSFAKWAMAAQATESDFERLTALYDACGGDAAMTYDTMRRANAPAATQSFLVPGLIPRGVLTLLGGNKKIGKSAVALELAVATASREREWLGFPLDTSQGGFSVYCFGEDHPGEVQRRIEAMTGGSTPLLLQPIPADGQGIEAVLNRLKDQKVAILIVDPARKYFRGDEDGSDAVSDFLTKLETFARLKNCAVLLLHHLKKNMTPQTLVEVALQLRGSGVFLDRVRVALTMLRKKDETHFGIPAPDGTPIHNFVASTMFVGVRRLRRNEANFRHITLDAPAAGKLKVANTLAIDSVLGTARGLIGAGERVTRTGKAGLFERKPKTLAGMPRAAVRSAVDVLIGQGLLDSDNGGVLTLPAIAQPASAMADLVG
jgi:hypothetical protein